jgi:hypothetical protein
MFGNVSMKPNRNCPAISFLLLFPVLICMSLQAGVIVQWPLASGGNGHYYRVGLATGGITWQQARDAATRAGGYLATITNTAENDFVYGLASADTNFWLLYQGYGLGPWLGGQQAEGAPEPAGGWQWVTGEAFSFAPWAPPEPNNFLTNENRIHFYGYLKLMDKTWNDYPDLPNPQQPSPRGYIVEWDSVPPPLLSARVSELEICWESVSNATYQVQVLSGLPNSSWTILRLCVASGGSQTCITDKVLPSDPQKYYRAILTNCVPQP